MARRGEPDLTTLFLVAGAGGAMLGAGMLAASRGIGQAIGATIADAINAKRLRDWQAAVTTKADEAEKLFVQFEKLRSEWIIPGSAHDSITTAAIDDFKQEMKSAFDAATVFDAYDLLDQLVIKMHRRLEVDRAIAKNLFNTTVRKRAKALLEDVRS